MIGKKLTCEHCKVYLDLIYRLIALVERQDMNLKQQKQEVEAKKEAIERMLGRK